MKSFSKLAAAFFLIAAAVALCAPGPDAPALLSVAEGSSEHYLVTNDGDGYNGMLNTGTVLRLEGTAKDPQLKPINTLKTGVTGNGGGMAVLRAGSDICAFLANPNYDADSISAFKYPGLQLVGNFADPQWSQSGDGLGIAAHGNYLFSAFFVNVPPYLSYIDVWTIGSGCALTLQGTYPVASQNSPLVTSMAVTPDGKTLIVSYSYEGEVDSFSIAANGSLTEHGPYDEVFALSAGGIDMTADSRYALFAMDEDYPYNYTDVAVYTINSDGTLGKAYNFGDDGQLGPGKGPGTVWLSPDEKFLFVTDVASGSQRVTTLNFTESPLNLVYNGCIITPRKTSYPTVVGGMASVLPSGAGGELYLAEDDGAIGLFAINSSTGCLSEESHSPYGTGQPSLASLTAWPPRPF